MTTRTEAWWVCNVCRKPISRVKGNAKKLETFLEHRKICGPTAGCYIQQIDQKERPKRESPGR